MPKPSHASLVHKATMAVRYFERYQREQPESVTWVEGVAHAKEWLDLLNRKAWSISDVRSLHDRVGQQDLGTMWHEMHMWIGVWLEALEGEASS